MSKTLILIFLLIQIFPAHSQKDHLLSMPGTKLHYRTFGSGVPLLILNGGPGMSSEGFIPLAKELSKHARTILYDQRGTGLSKLDTVNTSTVTMELMIRDMEVLRKNLGIDQWILMGHSFGGILAYYYATIYPHRVIAMIQSSSGGMDLSLLSSLNITESLSAMERDSLQYYNRQIAVGDTSYATRLKRGKFLAPAYVYKRENIPIIAERLTQGNGTINNLVWQDLRRMNYNTKTELKKFKKPVLILHGKEDIVSLDIPRTAHKLLPNSKLVILDKTKHYGWLDCKETYFKEIENFLDSIISN